MRQRLGQRPAAIPAGGWLLVFLVFCVPQACGAPQAASISQAAKDAARADADMQGYVGAAEPKTAAEIYGQGVRETGWQTPAEERAGFHLPPGFEVELFADEELITKPLNMAWDHRGRLWVSSTLEYPYPAKPDVVPRDTIRILEDTDGDGRADKVTVFADRLNIPMGLIPVEDGVICFSIPNLWYLKDTDGDDRADQRWQLLGPFDTTRDTHGMVSSLNRGSDGWIYACHGFNNQSTVEAQDGSSVTLISGNTFRFRDNGSSIEQYTHGQVNPFGMTRDEWGNWYTADCHSKPLTALLPGACYPSFGRPHDGLGFAPDMMQHLHGSTAICGLSYYQASHFPAAYRNLFYSGNVMTSRINCNAPSWNGAMVTAVEQADFMTSDDPWFRPVDIQLGPDGALYVADFYNKIIGHYEVPLEHPERDRESGRIWRIVYRGDRSHVPATTLGEATQFSRVVLEAEDDERWPDLRRALADDNLTRRRLAIETALTALTADQLATGPANGRAFKKLYDHKRLAAEIIPAMLDGTESVPLRLSALEIAHRSGGLTEEQLRRLLDDQQTAPELVVLALRLCGEREGQPASELLAAARRWLFKPAAEEEHPRGEPAGGQNPSEQNPSEQDSRRQDSLGQAQITRAALELLGKKGSADDAARLLEFAAARDDHDPAMLHSARLAIRQLLRTDELLMALCAAWLPAEANGDSAAQPRAALPESSAHLLVRILPAVHSKTAAAAMLGYVDANGLSDGQVVEQAIVAASRYATPELVGQVLRAISKSSGGELAVRASRFHQLCDAFRAQHGGLNDELLAYGMTLQRELLASLRRELAESGGEVTWADGAGGDWQSQLRECGDGKAVELISSHTRGEQYTGVLRSEAIPSPRQLSFWLAGHNGPPDQADQRRNMVRLVDDKTNTALRVAYPPRHDRATLVTWELSEWVGQPVRIEVVDGDAGGAYAWLAVGRFSAPQLERGGMSETVEALTTNLRQGIRDTATEAGLGDSRLSRRQRGGLIVAALNGAQRQPLATLAQFAARLDRFDLLTAELLRTAGDADLATPLSRELCATATGSEQAGLAKALMSHPAGCLLLNNLLDQGVLSLRSLRGIEGLLPKGLDGVTRKALEAKLAEVAELPEESVDVAGRLARLSGEAVSLEAGKQLYTQHCAVCHQLGGEGKLVGPQLDGAIVRGKERLAEDILDPNRNVDKAFRITALLMDDDSVVTGLVQETEDGSTLAVTAQDGKRTEYPAELVVQRRESSQSLMPSNFGEVLSDEQLAALLTYLVNAGK